LSALNLQDRTLFCYLQAVDTDQWHLVQISIDSGAVLAAPPVCHTDDECPWSIEYYNP
jgi:hypothetical protein